MDDASDVNHFLNQLGLAMFTILKLRVYLNENTSFLHL